MITTTQGHGGPRRTNGPTEVLRNTSTNKQTVTTILTAYLRATGLSQDQIGYRLGLSRQAVSDRMRGRTLWTSEELPTVCQLVGLSVGDLYRKAGL